MSRKKKINNQNLLALWDNQCALLKDESFFPTTIFWLCVYMWLVGFFFQDSFAGNYFLVTLHEMISLSSELIYMGRFTSKQVGIPSISFWSNRCLKATCKWTSHFDFCEIPVSMQGKHKGDKGFPPNKYHRWVFLLFIHKWKLYRPTAGHT